MESSKGLRELTDIYLKEISADTALAASKAADKARGKAAAGGDREKAKAKAAQASRLYKASAEKRKKEPVAIADRSYPKGKGASYQEDKDWGYDEDGNSLNPVDIEKREREEDDLAGAPNKKGKKKAKKDFDGDGKLESPEGEYKGSKDKAIKKAMKKESHEKVTILRGLVEKKKESYKTVAAVIDYDRSKKGTDDADYDTEHGEDEKAKKERDYAAWEREKMKKDDPNWKHKKYSTSESVGTAIDKTLGAAGEIADTAIKLPAKAVGYVKGLKKGLKKAAKKGENKANESYEPDEILCNLVESGKFTMEEIAKISGIEIDEAQTAYEKARKAAARRAADRNAARRRGEMGGRMERETYTNEAGKEMHYKGYSA